MSHGARTNRIWFGATGNAVTALPRARALAFSLFLSLTPSEDAFAGMQQPHHQSAREENSSRLGINITLRGAR